MASPHQLTFVQSLPFGLSRSKGQQSEARAHAARAGHRKSREVHTGADVRPKPSAQTVIKFRLWQSKQLPSPQDEDDAEEVSTPAEGSRAYSVISKSTGFRLCLDLEGFRGLRVDPFFCIPKARDKQVGSAIDFYCQVLNNANDAVCYIFNVINIYNSVPEILQNDLFFDAGLGLIQSHQDQARVAGTPASVYTLKHKGNAIASIRSNLSKPIEAVDDMTIMAMVFLAALDKGLRNLASYHLHRKTIARLVHDRGGLKALPPGVLKNFLVHYDTFWVMEKAESMFPGERDRFEPTYPTRPFSLAACAIIARLPPGFRQLVIESTLSEQILQILCRTAHLTDLSGRDRVELLDKTRRSTSRYNDFFEACPGLCTSKVSCSELERLLSFTLVCYCFMALGWRSYPTLLRGARQEATALITLFRPESQIEEDCLIWMWVIVVDSWTIGSGLQPFGVSMLMLLQTRFPELRDRRAMVRVVSQFFWTHQLDKSIYEYWDDLISAD